MPVKKKKSKKPAKTGAAKKRRKPAASGRKKPAARKAARPGAGSKPKGRARKTGAGAKAARRKAWSGIGETTRVTRHPNVASRTIDGQEVVIVPSSRKLQMLNEVATRIWALCDGRTVKEIVDAITTEYEVTRATALRDVLDFVSEIRKRGMVEIA